MSKIEVQTIDAPSGQNTVTIGDSNASTITLKSGATLNNFPSNSPSFQAYLSSNSSTLTSGTQTKIQFNQEEFDTDSTYDNSTNYRFTPAVIGKYFCYASAKLDSTSTFPHDAYLSLYKNGTVVKRFQRTAQGSDFTGHLFVCGVIDLDADDYVEVYVVQYDGSGVFVATPQNSTQFGAYRLIT